ALACAPVDDTGSDDTATLDTDAFQPPPATPAPLLRGIHLSPDRATGCDLDGDLETTEDQFSACVALFIDPGRVPLVAAAVPVGASSAYLPVPIAGPRTVHAVDWNASQAAPGAGNVPENRVASFSVALTPGTVQTAVLYGSTTMGNTGVRLISEDLTPPEAGASHLRVFHGAYVVTSAVPDVALNGALVAEAMAYGTFSDAVVVTPGADQVLTVDLDGDEVPELVALISLDADHLYDLMVVNVPTSMVPSGFLGMLHTSESQEPVLVPFGPFTPPT